LSVGVVMMNDLIQLDETIALLRRDHHCSP